VPTRTIVAPSAIASSKSSDMPIDSVSIPAWVACSASNSARMRWNASRHSARSGVAAGIAISSRGRKFGVAATLAVSAAIAAGAQPDLFASSSILTWINTLSGPRLVGR
jgi:hypothetical protein